MYHVIINVFLTSFNLKSRCIEHDFPQIMRTEEAEELVKMFLSFRCQPLIQKALVLVAACFSSINKAEKLCQLFLESP